jgi:hypothetical protein
VRGQGRPQDKKGISKPRLKKNQNPKVLKVKMTKGEI